MEFVVPGWFRRHMGARYNQCRLCPYSKIPILKKMLRFVSGVSTLYNYLWIIDPPRGPSPVQNIGDSRELHEGLWSPKIYDLLGPCPASARSSIVAPWDIVVRRVWVSGQGWPVECRLLPRGATILTFLLYHIYPILLIIYVKNEVLTQIKWGTYKGPHRYWSCKG